MFLPSKKMAEIFFSPMLTYSDEVHRSGYNKYRDIFTYFDAPLVGLTATSKDEIDKNTYEVFGLENGVPTYGYDLAQAFEDEHDDLPDYAKVIDNYMTYSQSAIDEFLNQRKCRR